MKDKYRVNMRKNIKGSVGKKQKNTYIPFKNPHYVLTMFHYMV